MGTVSPSMTAASPGTTSRADAVGRRPRDLDPGRVGDDGRRRVAEVQRHAALRAEHHRGRRARQHLAAAAVERDAAEPGHDPQRDRRAPAAEVGDRLLVGDRELEPRVLQPHLEREAPVAGVGEHEPPRILGRALAGDRDVKPRRCEQRPQRVEHVGVAGQVLLEHPLVVAADRADRVGEQLDGRGQIDGPRRGAGRRRHPQQHAQRVARAPSRSSTSSARSPATSPATSASVSGFVRSSTK